MNTHVPAPPGAPHAAGPNGPDTMQVTRMVVENANAWREEVARNYERQKLAVMAAVRANRQGAALEFARAVKYLQQQTQAAPSQPANDGAAPAAPPAAPRAAAPPGAARPAAPQARPPAAAPGSAPQGAAPTANSGMADNLLAAFDAEMTPATAAVIERMSQLIRNIVAQEVKSQLAALVAEATAQARTQTTAPTPTPGAQSSAAPTNYFPR